MGEAIISRFGAGEDPNAVKMEWKLYTEVITENTTYTVPTCKNQELHVMCFGGGGGAWLRWDGDTSQNSYSGSGGGGGGNMNKAVLSLSAGSTIPVTIGSGGLATNYSTRTGGTTSFGSYLSASGGGGANQSYGGDGGTGGGSCLYDANGGVGRPWYSECWTYNPIGNGTYGGGGGYCYHAIGISQYWNVYHIFVGGNGGTYGGRGSSQIAAVYAHNNSSLHGKTMYAAPNGITTNCGMLHITNFRNNIRYDINNLNGTDVSEEMINDFDKSIFNNINSGLIKSNHGDIVYTNGINYTPYEYTINNSKQQYTIRYCTFPAEGGYGSKGGTTICSTYEFGGGGGGGYFANGGNGSWDSSSHYFAGGGGGGYGGKGGDGYTSYQVMCGGGGGGYGLSNYGSGATAPMQLNGNSGCIVIQYYGVVYV